MTALLCTVCRSPDVIAIKPGEEGEYSELLGQRIWTRQHTPDVMWCERCWPWRKAVAS